jgi:predicted metal-dependent hydrolase
MNGNQPEEFWLGVEQFNAGQFYACHDTLEALWIEATEPEKTLYQGILQIAVALYHLENSNLRGAMILLGEGTNRLRRLPDDNNYGINLGQLLIDSVNFLRAIQQEKPEVVSTMTLPKIVRSNPPDTDSKVSKTP